MSDFTIAPQTQPSKDHPLSSRGRFNRLSYLGWHGLISIGFILIFVLLVSIAGNVSINNVNMNEPMFSAFSGIATFAIIALWFAGFYFQIVFLIRRLHDLNKTGWLCLLLLVPLIQLFFTLYVLLAPGTPYRNDYGDVRPSKAWEKLLAWIMIILSIFILFSMSVFMYYFASPDIWDAPTQIIQNTTEYF
ncbi:DUF805 domain-containing protein [Acinetobacter venetianus]|uniref:DUF805 domain-containing protein n=1 Tax=Acinetobacter venetianus TaxID=52133 RepID=A0A150I2W2_9GAMM|nr:MULTISPECIES: DUF805 domain-containing protein [Acinetobacter]KXZ73858.1 hypothetical protein AVENLUH5627_00365 [Acinetobacter venetianus]